MSRTRRNVIAPIVLGVVGTAILLFLGAWQVQRLAWKEGLIAEIEARMAADPVAVPAAPDAEADKLRRVSASGMLDGRELHAISSVKTLGPGFRIIVPMVLAGSERTIMVDLGFVPERMKAPEKRPDPLTTPRQIELTGLLAWPNEIDSFTPAPDQAKNIWFARDVPAMAAALGAEPVLVIADSHSLGEWPRARPPGVGVQNRHLEYALTWFGLAIVWTGMSIAWLRAELRRPRPGAA